MPFIRSERRELRIDSKKMNQETRTKIKKLINYLKNGRWSRLLLVKSIFNSASYRNVGHSDEGRGSHKKDEMLCNAAGQTFTVFIMMPTIAIILSVLFPKC